MIDWRTLLYDPIYDGDLGVDAVLASAGGATVTIRALDKTAGIAIADRSQVETVRPVANVRAGELSDKNIAIADLPEGYLTLNGATWRIKSTRVLPSPAGESAGEVMLILLNEP